jgi:rubrerythrin
MIDRKEAYRLAIMNEIKAQILYELMSASFKERPETAIVFKRLIPLEKMHEDKLRAAFKKEFPNAVLNTDEKQQPYMKPADINDPKKVLIFAIYREIDAAKMYKSMAAETTDADLIDLLNQLARDEENHQAILEQEIALLQGQMSWFDPSELSGLVED